MASEMDVVVQVADRSYDDLAITPSVTADPEATGERSDTSRMSHGCATSHPSAWVAVAGCKVPLSRFLRKPSG